MICLDALGPRGLGVHRHILSGERREFERDENKNRYFWGITRELIKTYPGYIPPHFYFPVSVAVDVGGESPGLVAVLKTIDISGAKANKFDIFLVTVPHSFGYH